MVFRPNGARKTFCPLSPRVSIDSMTNNINDFIKYLRELLVFQMPDTIQNKMAISREYSIGPYIARLLQAACFKIVIPKGHRIFVFDDLTGDLTED